MSNARLTSWCEFGVAAAEPLSEDARETVAPFVQWSAARPGDAGVASVISTIVERAHEQIMQDEGSVTLQSGCRYSIDLRDKFALRLAYGYLPEFADFNVFLRLVQPDSVVLDVGANFGLYSVDCARIIEGGHVYAFEAAPAIFQRLQRNIAANAQSNKISARNAAVAEAAGRRTFFVSSQGSLSGLSDTGRAPVAEKIVIECIALDALEELEGRAADLMKIDVEGAEAGVLRGARALLARSPEIIVQFEVSSKNMSNEGVADLQRVLDDLHAQGFVLHRNGANGADETGVALKPGEHGNLYLVRSGSQAEARLLSAFEAEARAAQARSKTAPSVDVLVKGLAEVLRDDAKLVSHLRKLRLSADEELAAARQANEQAFAQVATLQRETGKVDELRRQIEESEHRRARLETAYVAADRRSAHLDTLMKRTNEELAEAIAAAGKLQSRLQEAEVLSADRVQKLVEAIRRAAHFQEIAGNTAEKLDQSRLAAAALRETLAAQQAKTKEQETQLIELTQAAERGSAELAALQSSLAEAQARAKTEAEQMRAKLEKSEGKTAAHEQRLVKATRRAGHLYVLSQRAQDELTAAKGQLARAKEQLSAASQELTEVKGRLGATNQELTDVKGRLGSASQQLETVKGDLAQSRQLASQLESEIVAIQRSTWWRFGRRVVFPVVNLLKRKD